MSDSEKNQRVDSPGGLEELFGLLEGPLLGYARKLLKDNETAQDVVQEAFIRLNERFGDIASPRAWLYRTVHNLAVDHWRRNRMMLPTRDIETEVAEGEDPEPLPDARIERMEAIGLARLFIGEMEERKRELLRMKFEEELSYKEMAARLGVSVGNVGYLIHHALRELAQELEKEGVVK